MKIAIVGTTANLTPDEYKVMRGEITLILKQYPLDTIIISGGAKGVDTISLEVAQELGFKIIKYTPEKNQWEYYKKRNLQLAADCDELYCFSIRVRNTKCYHHNSPQNHEKTAGCWTKNKVLLLKKPSHLVIISNNTFKEI